MPQVKKLSQVFALSAVSIMVASNALAADPSKEDVSAIVDSKIEALLASEEFSAKVEETIVEFIRKSEQRKREEQRKQALEEQRRIQELAKNLVLPNNADHVRGNPDAEYTLITYTDFECPFCKRFHEESALPFFEKHGEEVNWIYRHYPLSFHNPGAIEQSNAAECAAELGGAEAFWKYSDAILERTASGGKGFALSQLTPLAVEIGLDESKFQDCVESQKYFSKIETQIRQGSAAGVTGTPGNFLVHNPSGTIEVIKGAQPLQSVEQSFQILKNKVK